MAGDTAGFSLLVRAPAMWGWPEPGGHEIKEGPQRMWPFTTRAGTGAEQPAKKHCCSFCGKSQDDVAKLIAGPEVFICDECVALCNDILAEERREGNERGTAEGGEPPAPEQVHCRLCGCAGEPEEFVMVPNRGPLCLPCLEEIRLVIGEGEEGRHMGAHSQPTS